MPFEAVEVCIRGELALLTRATRSDAAAVAALLDEDFREIGKSGRVYTRGDILASITGAPADIQAADVVGEVLAEGVVLVRYRTENAAGQRAQRASIWVRCSDGQWRMRHHQGTLVSGAEA